MARCEDFPCCGHELGCCPDYDPETGEQLNMKCTCGATVPITSRFSICDGCLNPGRRRTRPAGSRYEDADDEPTDEPVEACSDPEKLGDGHGLGEQASECSACELHLDDDQDVDYGDREFEIYGHDYPEDY